MYAILVVETGSDVEVELCRVGTNPEPIAAAARARIIGKRTKISPLPLGTRRGSERGVVVNLFGNPTLIGLQVRLDRPVDRERPCCKNICTIGAAKGPHAGELICADCGCHRGWLSKSSARWIEHVITRFGAPTTPIVVRKSHTYQEEVPDTDPSPP